VIRRGGLATGMLTAAVLRPPARHRHGQRFHARAPRGYAHHGRALAGRRIWSSGGGFDGRGIGRVTARQRLARADIAMLVMSMMVLIVSVFMTMFMMVVIMMLCIGVVLFGLVRVLVTVFGVQVFRVLLALRRLGGLCGISACVLDDLALDAVATAAAAGTAVARTAAVGRFSLSSSASRWARSSLDQRLADRRPGLIVVRMDFAEGQKTVTVAAIFDEGRLQ